MDMKKQQREQIYQSLLADDAFFQWLLCPNSELDEYWKKIMLENPDKNEAVNDLKTILKGMKVVEKGMSEEEKKELWRKIENASRPKKRSFRLLPFLRYAAIFLIALTTSVYVYMNHKQRQDKLIDYQSFMPDSSTAEIQSGKVLIVLTNKEIIEMEASDVGLMHDAEGKMSINSKVIEEGKTADKTENEFNQLYVPYGKTTSIVMSDGTKVWVNSGTRVVYPPVFAGNKREIYVEGEIYLEVARNEKSPFIVKTDRMEISVLGTSFNVSAYKTDEKQSVVLANGSVSIKENKEKTETTIKPNQKYTFEKSTNISNVQEVDIFDYICWKYGFLSFKKEKLSAVLKRVERYYNVRIDYNAPEIDRTTLSGKLDLKEDISETFRIISITAPIEYDMRNEVIKINVKP
ncbi:iron dicitrate transporter FecR [Bacteroidia bacterium]|nr:iron dicitrate transporter FecR [Bacteroidia bacterium]